eukprot:SAG22_NODE_2093_length_3020_cov_8.343033_3_plen_64_part_00
MRMPHRILYFKKNMHDKFMHAARSNSRLSRLNNIDVIYLGNDVKRARSQIFIYSLLIIKILKC